MSPAADFLLGLLVCLLASGKCTDLPRATFGSDCLERYFRLAFDSSFTGEDIRFEAVDYTGIHPITEQYAAECGYSISLRPHLGLAELRASYFSCHAFNEDDETFTFSFNMIVTQDGVEETYDVNKTCTPTLPWSSREINCEINYMELSMRKDMRFPMGTKGGRWTSTLDVAYGLAHNDWQVLFQKGDQQFSPTTLSAAREMGYTFSMTEGRYVFRMPYGQPDSTSVLVDGVTVDTVHATLFTRRGWTVLVVDLLAACPMSDGFYNDSSLVWVNPMETGDADQRSQRLRIGANGHLLEPAAAMERGYNMEVFGSLVHVTIPYDAEGGYKKSFVQHNVYREYYLINLYFENQFIDVNQMDTRLRQYRPLVSPLLSWRSSCINQTVLSEHTFTVYIGLFAEDVQLTALMLTGREYLGDVMNANITEVVHPNHTHGYTLGMRFDHPIIPMELSEDGILQYTLDMNFTLSIIPAMVESFYLHATVVAVFEDVFPPIFEAHCYEKGIGFKLHLGPFAYLWAVYVGPHALTEAFALEQGYSLTNTSKGQILNVPLFSTGYVYKNIGIKTFAATFEILVRDLKTLKVKGTTVKTCQFATTEMIICSPDGQVTMVANLSAIPSAGDPYRLSLLNRTCGADARDNSMALFTFGVQTCGMRVKLTTDLIVYENEVVFMPKFPTAKGPQSLAVKAPERITVQCAYHLSGLYRLFQLHKFVSDYAGVGSIRHDSHLVQQKMQYNGNDPAADALLNVSSAEEMEDDQPKSKTKYSRVVHFLKDLVTAKLQP